MCEPTFSRGLFGNTVPRACDEHTEGEAYVTVDMLQTILSNAIQIGTQYLPFEDDLRAALAEVQERSKHSVERLGMTEEQVEALDRGNLLIEATLDYMLTLRDLGLEQALLMSGSDPDTFDWDAEADLTEGEAE